MEEAKRWSGVDDKVVAVVKSIKLFQDAPSRALAQVANSQSHHFSPPVTPFPLPPSFHPAIPQATAESSGLCRKQGGRGRGWVTQG
eukprot:1194410-Rhodomonas_salina.2